MGCGQDGGMLIVYAYKGCDTCRKAVKWLKERGVPHEVKAIRETPPTVAELESALAAFGGDPRPLFNTSGGDYRELGLKDKLPALGAAEALALLAANGNLVKRPFAIGGGRVLVGFKPADWERAFGGASGG
jgi:arsenate reductase